MLGRKAIQFLILGAIYLATWIGGWISHASEMHAEASISYSAAERYNLEFKAQALARGQEPFAFRLHEGGPRTGVIWCIPVLPGVLLADSYRSIGPLGGKGTVKIVLYYGFGSLIICDLWGWIS